MFLVPKTYFIIETTWSQYLRRFEIAAKHPCLKSAEKTYKFIVNVNFELNNISFKQGADNFIWNFFKTSTAYFSLQICLNFKEPTL